MVACDFETTGLSPQADRAVMVSLSNGTACLALSLDDMSSERKRDFFNWLCDRHVVFHNAGFDLSWIFKECGRIPKEFSCTMAMFKYLANEGWIGQSHSLKTAMVDILGWEEPNNTELKTWLRENKLTLADMSQAPIEILGKYAALDADATYKLWDYLRKEVKRFPHLQEYLATEWKSCVKVHLAQQAAGLKIDRKRLLAYRETLEAKQKDIEAELLAAPGIQAGLLKMQANEIDLAGSKEPNERNKPTKKDPLGKVSKRWESWAEKVQLLSEQSSFNINSKPQLSWLLFQHLGLETPIVTDTGSPALNKKSLPYLGDYGKILSRLADCQTTLRFVLALLDQSETTGRLHPMLKVPGTITGRLSGGVD